MSGCSPDVDTLDVIPFCLDVHHHQQHRAVLSKFEAGNPGATAFARTAQGPSHLARPSAPGIRSPAKVFAAIQKINASLSSAD
jgi:hypothetical protein